MTKTRKNRRPVTELVWVPTAAGKMTQVRRGTAAHRAARPQDFGGAPVATPEEMAELLALVAKALVV